MPDNLNWEKQLESETLQRIRLFTAERESAASRVPTPEGKLFHYTTADGLKGIIEKNELWAASAYFLNDSSEIAYGCGILKQVLDEWVDGKKPTTSIPNRVRQLLQESIEFELSSNNISGIANVYLACFCEEENLLSQWREYGQSGGYSIGFNIPHQAASEILKPEDPGVFIARCVKVEYDRNKQLDNCRQVLNALLPQFDNETIERLIIAAGGHEREASLMIARATWQFLLDEIVRFKNRAFEVEKEWRIVVRYKNYFERDRTAGSAATLPIHFRSLRGALTPYVKLLPVSGKLPISRFRSGPTLDSNAAKMAIALILYQNGFPRVPVEGADIPVKL